jgi:hypothetical protein
VFAVLFSCHVTHTDRVSAKRPLGLMIRSGDGRDAHPHDPRQDVRWLTSGAAPSIVCAFRRVRRRTFTDAFQRCDAGRARVQLHLNGPFKGKSPDHLGWFGRMGRRITSRRRPYSCERPQSSSRHQIFGGCRWCAPRPSAGSLGRRPTTR